MRSPTLLSSLAVACLLAVLCAAGQTPAASSNPQLIPHLEKRGRATQLMVDGRPFLVIGGEPRNNSATSLQYMKPIWFIPEAVAGDRGAAEAFYAFGNHNAIGFSPFSIDRMPGEAEAALRHGYEILSQLSPMILKAQTNGTIAAPMLEPANRSLRLRLGDYTLDISRAEGFRPPAPAPTAGSIDAPTAPVPHAIFINTAPGEYYVAGSDLKITFTPETPGPPIAGLGTVEEGSFVDGRWVAGRMLAGDATGEGNALYLRSGTEQKILHVTVYRYR
jgi:Domain of unknown function (DUF5597)